MEAVGVIAGVGGRPTRWLPMVNAARSQVRFEVDPNDVYLLHLDMERHGEELQVLVHSHTLGRKAIPSEPDIAMCPPGVQLLIVPVSSQKIAGRPRLWEVADGQATEIPL